MEVIYLIKLNNKGMSLIELLICFSSFFIILISLYNLIIDAEVNLTSKEKIKQITDYSSFRNNEIHFDMIKNKPFTFILKEKDNLEFKCLNKYCTINDGVIIKYNNNYKKITNSNLDSTYCKNLYPCSIYFYLDKNEIKTVSIALGNNNYKLKNGILYGKDDNLKYYKLPYNDEVKVNTDNKIKEKNISLAFKNNIFVLNYPYYLKDNINYGFKIVYPVE